MFSFLFHCARVKVCVWCGERLENPPRAKLNKPSLIRTYSPPRKLPLSIIWKKVRAVINDYKNNCQRNNKLVAIDTVSYAVMSLQIQIYGWAKRNRLHWKIAGEFSSRSSDTFLPGNKYNSQKNKLEYWDGRLNE